MALICFWQLACSVGTTPLLQLVTDDLARSAVISNNLGECIGTQTVHARFCRRNQQRADCIRHSICKWEKSGAVVIID